MERPVRHGFCWEGFQEHCVQYTCPRTVLCGESLYKNADDCLQERVQLCRSLAGRILTPEKKIIWSCNKLTESSAPLTIRVARQLKEISQAQIMEGDIHHHDCKGHLDRINMPTSLLSCLTSAIPLLGFHTAGPVHCIPAHGRALLVASVL